MQTRLAILCDKLLEAGWLAALILAPLFFDVYSSRVFEPDKITLVRSLALMMIGAWLIKQIEAGIGRSSFAESLRAFWHATPLTIPTFVIIVSYSLSTILSVVPTTSLGGSYQRLQGTYTTFSYITIFLVAASALRTRAQLDRAINTAIVTSLPIALYGILQHYRADPLPWGGDTTDRVASNMGNSIFVAAYLIMIVPLTLARWIETLARASAASVSRLATGIVAVLIVVALTGIWLVNFGVGAGVALFLLPFALIVAPLTRIRTRDALLLATYSIVLAAQINTIIFSQSRGPELGLGAGMFAFLLLGALILMPRLSRGWRTVSLGAIIGLATLVIAFLVVFNLPASPIEALKNVPYIGRLGQILDPNSPTAQVRELIWQGALKLVLPHQPLWSPITGADPLNAIRPLVGYGPEAMYVAYNPFYPPPLADLESRNASPDRSHNETFDALVTTGLLGFGAYVLLYMSVFYFGLKWLGLINTAAERNAFIALWLAGGFIFAIGFGAWRGWHWIGVALPAGMIVGFLVFLVADALRHYRSDERVLDMRRALWLAALIAALIGHFVEVHFGIAIVSTRTYFWFYAALLGIIGLNRLDEPMPMPRVVAPARAEPSPLDEPARNAAQRRKQRRRVSETPRPTVIRAKTVTQSPASVVAWTALTTLILVTLSFEFITNQIGTPSPLEVVRHALFYLGDNVSFGVLFMLGLTWLAAGIIGLGELGGDAPPDRSSHLYDMALFAVLSFTALLWFVLVQTRLITTAGDLTDSFMTLIGVFYIALFLIVGVLAIALGFDDLPQIPAFIRAPLNALVAPLAIVIVSALVYTTNLSGITADILYKAGNSYDASGAWDNSIAAYQRALNSQPTQDFYALFLGRAYLEAGRASTDPTKRAARFADSEKVLLNAQRLNSLNTDHTANLARLHRILATFATDPTQRAAEFKKSSDYYQAATRLSPNTAYLRNEWSQTYSQSGDWENARAQLEISLKLDQKFAQTYLYLGEYYRAKNDSENAITNYLQALALDNNALFDVDGSLQAGPASVLAKPANLPRAVEAFRALAAANPTALAPHQALADLYKRSGQTDRARQELEQIAQLAPNDYLAQIALVNFLSENGQVDAAVTAMKHVMDLLSPQRNSDYARYQDFYGQLQNLQKAQQAAQKSPDDLNAQRALASIWKARGQPQFALPQYQTIVRLAPNDYDAQKNVALLSLQTNQVDLAQNALPAAANLAAANEKTFWQNLLAALNAQKAGQVTQAVQAAQAALALATDADKPAVQAYLTLLQSTPNK